MLKDEYKIYASKMQKSVDSVAADFAAVRAGRANASVLDRITVDYYGSPTPIQQIASITSPDPRSLVIQPWDASAVKLIKKAIETSDLGINPQDDGRSLRLAFPQLTEERRKELVKQIRKYAEGGKVAVRNIRDRAILEALGYQTVAVSQIDPTAYDLIFNSAPELLLPNCKGTALKIDLASKPGITGEDVIWARGLPGKMAPAAAGKQMARRILYYSKEWSV